MIYSRQIKRRVDDFDESNSPFAVVGPPDTVEKIKTRKIYSTWTAVKDRLPDSSGDYLVLLRSAQHRVMSYSQEGETFMPRCINRTITHWMPLPKAPA
jgi:hypothetical protein